MSYPQLILLGNGINRAYSGGSWNDMLRAITQREDLPANLNSPMPLQAILASNDHLSTALHTQEFVQTWHVEILDCNFVESCGRPCDYKAFYNAAIHDIKQKLERK